MNTLSTTILHSAALTGVLLLPIGCTNPSAANIELRKQNQQLTQEVQNLKQQQQGAQQVIEGLRQSKGTLPTLPATRLANLYTTHGIHFNRLTGGADIDPKKSGDEGLAVYVFPVDQYDQKLKAAGTFDIEAFDLANPADPLVGKWHLDLDQANAGWNSTLLEYTYGFILPFQKPPRHPDITIKVTFFDELTQTRFTNQKVITISLPPPPQPTSRP